MNDTSIDGQTGLARDYVKLAHDENARWGYAPIIVNGTWRQTNASRYIRRFQSRRSLLMWKIFGQRLDGWTNGEHPTETIPGDVSTIVPPGSNPNNADIDYTGTIMPPAGSGVPDLTIDEKMIFARWIDLGCPINFGVESGHGNLGWFLDDMRPSLNVNQPRAGQNSNSISEIRFGTSDAYTGVNPNSISVTSDLSIAGRPPGAELFDLAQGVASGVYSIQLSPPIAQAQNAHVSVRSADQQGNISRVNQEFSVGAPLFLFKDDFEDGDASDWGYSKGTWSVVAGALTGTTPKKADALAPFVGCSSCTIEADIRFDVAGGKISLLAWFADKKNYTEAVLREDKDKLQVIQKIGGLTVVKLKANVTFNVGVTHRIRINLNAGTYTASVDGVIVTSGPAQGTPSGAVGFRIRKATASFNEITVF